MNLKDVNLVYEHAYLSIGDGFYLECMVIVNKPLSKTDLTEIAIDRLWKYIESVYKGEIRSFILLEPYKPGGLKIKATHCNFVYKVEHLFKLIQDSEWYEKNAQHSHEYILVKKIGY